MPRPFFLSVNLSNSGFGDIDILGFRHEQHADHEGDGREDHRIPETGVDIAGRGDDRESGRRQQATEPAVADMIGQRHRGVADAGREHFDQHGGDWPVHHGHIEHQDEQQPDGGRDLWTEDVERIRHLHDARITRLRIARGLHGRGDRRVRCLDVGVGDFLVVDEDLDRRTRRGTERRILHRRRGQEGARGIAGRAEHTGADRIEQVAARRRVRHDLHLDRLIGLFQRRVGVGRDHLEDREQGERADQAARHDDRLAADAIGEGAEEQEESGSQQQRPGDQQVGGIAVNLEDRLQEEQRVELAGVPDHRLAHGEADQGEQHDLAVGPVGERLGERRLGALAFVLHLLEHRRLVEAEPDPDRDAEQQHRDQERDAPAPDREVRFTGEGAGKQNHQQGEEQAERRGGLNERGVVTALAVRRMLGDIGRGAAVFATQRKALQQAQRDQDDRGRDADGGGAGQQADDERRQAHDQDGHQEGVLAADDVTDPAEHDGAERPHQEAGGECQQGENVTRAFRIGAEELGADDRCQRSVEIEIVPFEHGPER